MSYTLEWQLPNEAVTKTSHLCQDKLKMCAGFALFLEFVQERYTEALCSWRFHNLNMCMYICEIERKLRKERGRKEMGQREREGGREMGQHSDWISNLLQAHCQNCCMRTWPPSPPESVAAMLGGEGNSSCTARVRRPPSTHATRNPAPFPLRRLWMYIITPSAELWPVSIVHGQCGAASEPAIPAVDMPLKCTCSE